MKESYTQKQLRAEQDALIRLAHALRDGTRPPDSSMPGRALCVVPGCSGISFAEVRTGLGPEGVCFRHFQRLGEIVRDQDAS